MGSNFRSWAGTGYLVLVLLLGGASAAALGPNALLGLAGAVLVGLSLWSTPLSTGVSTGLRPFMIALAGLAALQFLPLPPAIWTMLPGRDEVAKGYALAAMPLPWLNLSLDPWASLQSFAWWIPALALFASARMNDAVLSRQIIRVVAIVAYCSVGLAVVQVFGGSGYFYAITNRGNGVGLFANSNHFGSFMLIALALVGGQWIHDRPIVHRLNPAMAKGSMLLVRLMPFAVGVFLSNSLACAILFTPVAAGVLLLFRPQIRIYWPAVALGLPILVAGMLWLLASGWISNDLMAKSGTTGISRGEFLQNGIAMAKSFAVLGSGLGTFREIYPWFESPDFVGTTFVNHAHNDLLELVIETGLLGIGLLALFLRWYVGKLRKLWTTDRAGNPVAAAASIAIGAVLVHSLADYPMRTAAISGLVAICLVLMCREPDRLGGSADAKQTNRTKQFVI